MYAAASSVCACGLRLLSLARPDVTATAAAATTPTTRPATTARTTIDPFVAGTVPTCEAGRDVPPHRFCHPRSGRHPCLLHGGHGLRAREGRGRPHAQGRLGQALLLRHRRRRTDGVLG